jgi:hypothetical protein
MKPFYLRSVQSSFVSNVLVLVLVVVSCTIGWRMWMVLVPPVTWEVPRVARSARPRTHVMLCSLCLWFVFCVPVLCLVCFSATTR